MEALASNPFDCDALFDFVSSKVPGIKTHCKPSLCHYAAYRLEPSLLHGRRLVEIFRVRMDDIDDERPGDLYGTISHSSGQFLFNKASKDYQKISQGQDIVLTGPDRAIVVEPGMFMNFELWDEDFLSFDDWVVDHHMAWPLSEEETLYNVASSQEITGPYGRGMVEFVNMDNAVEASIKVTLVNGDDEKPADIYGNITAKSKFGTSELFRKISKEHIDVYPGYDIPLSRHAIAVPKGSTLVIDANVWDHDGDASGDDEVAKGSAEFEPRTSVPESKRISGKYGSIMVTVAWLSH